MNLLSTIPADCPGPANAKVPPRSPTDAKLPDSARTAIANNGAHVRRTWALVAILAISTILVYLPSLNAPFIFDDCVVTEFETDLRNPSLSNLHKVGYERRPVIFYSLALNYALGGRNVVGYHLLNLVVHVIAGLTLFGIVRRTLRLPKFGKKFGKSADPLAFATALLWLVHPLQTQAVAYMIQRCESAMGMFYLLSLYCLVRGSQSSCARRWYVGGVVAGWLGMGCKEVMVTAPVVLLLYDRIFLSASWRLLFHRRWPFHLAMTTILVCLLVSGAAEVAPSAGFACEVVSPWEYVRSQPGVLLHYLRLAVLPDRLCFDYRWPVASTWQEIVIPAAVVGLLVMAGVLALRFRPALGFLGTSFFLVLAPSSSIVPIADLAFEHRMYLPLATLVVLGVLGVYMGIGKVAGVRSRASFLILALVVAASMFMLRTAARNSLYRSPLAVWQNTLSIAPHNDRAHYVCGVHHAKSGNADQAIDHFRDAIRVNPKHVEAHLDLASALARSGKIEEAIEHFERALRINPKISAAHYNLGILRTRQGDAPGALAHFRRAVELKPERSEYKDMLAAALHRCSSTPDQERERL